MSVISNEKVGISLMMRKFPSKQKNNEYVIFILTFIFDGTEKAGELLLTSNAIHISEPSQMYVSRSNIKQYGR